MKPNNFPLRPSLNGTEELYTQTNDVAQKFTLNSAKAFVNAIEVTYETLTKLIDNSYLIAGSHYIITDFRTCYDQPDYNANGNSINGTYKEADIEPIIVMATSENTLAPDAYQPKYPNDKIKYDVFFDTTESTSGDAYGRITERIDEWNNRTDYDHRTILFKRYKTYFHDFSNPLAGTINVTTVSSTTGGYQITVVGVDTDFENELNEEDVIYVNKYWYKVDTITSATGMVLTSVESNSFSGEKYYKATSQTEGSLSQIPYTHTQMTDPPVDDDEEASIGDFIMDGQVKSSVNYFCGSIGTSEYFTNLYPGLFVMAAKEIEIDFFRIDGNIGADGDGTADINQYTTNVNGNDYTAFIKRVYNADDPSINQIFIVNGDGTGISQTYDSSTTDDFHEISNLATTGVTEIHYLLTSRGTGDKLEDADFEALVDAYLNLVEGANIENTLNILNTNYSTLTALVPDIYLFNDVADINDEGENTIDDGGDDIYDGANFIYTDFSVRYRSYEYKNNNIINDVYREMTTFRSQEELQLNDEVTSTNNWIGDYSTFYIQGNLSNSDFLLANNVFGFNSYSNKLGNRCFNNSTYNWFNRNQISGTFQNNSLRRGFYANVVGEYFTDNVFNGQTWRNKIGENFENNVTGTDDFQNNVINNGFNDNYIALRDDFYKNFIGNGFNNNWIWDEFYGNHIGNAYNDNVIYNVFADNHILDYFDNNTIGNSDFIGSYDFTDNIIGNDFKNNLAEGNFFKNHIGHDFVSNESETEFRNNVIGNTFLDNNVGEDFAYNIIGDNFGNNTIGNSFGYGGSVLRGNKIGNSFANNTIGVDCYDNVIGNNFFNNTIVDYFKYNQILYPISATNFSTATHVYAEYDCTIIRGSDGNYYLQYFDGTDIQSVSITA
jgi:hypothetical protein